MLRIGSAVLAVTLCACGGGGSGNEEKTVPNPVGPGEIINVSLCGSTTEPRSPCGDAQNNIIQLRVGSSGGAQCPCFNFGFLNQNLTDLGASGGVTTYEFSGFRPGSFTVTGQFTTPAVSFEFSHNPSTSTIGIAPASLQSISGPVTTATRPCQIAYAGSNVSRTPIPFSFQFTVAAASSGGSC